MDGINTRFEIEKVRISDLIVSDDYQIRDSLDEVLIEDLRAALSAGTLLTEVICFRCGDDLILVDGFHRVEAAKRIGLVDLMAQIKNGTTDDALRFVTSKSHPNNRHGNKYTPAERRAAVRLSLRKWPEMGDSWHGDHCSMDHKTVTEIREDAERTLGIPKVEVTVGKDGKKYRKNRADTSQPVPRNEPKSKTEKPKKQARGSKFGTAEEIAKRDAQVIDLLKYKGAREVAEDLGLSTSVVHGIKQRNGLQKKRSTTQERFLANARSMVEVLGGMSDVLSPTEEVLKTVTALKNAANNLHKALTRLKKEAAGVSN